MRVNRPVPSERVDSLIYLPADAPVVVRLDIVPPPPRCVLVNSGVWHSRLSHLQISKILKKISYETRRNLLQPQTGKNLLRKWSRFCKNIL